MESTQNATRKVKIVLPRISPKRVILLFECTLFVPITLN